MSISIVFSFAVYRLYTNELRQNFERDLFAQPRNALILRQLDQESLDELFEMIKERQGNNYSSATTRMRQNLVIINISILVSGGLLSYYLARRTLRPIEEALAAQERFTADASHELRTPITAIKTETEVTLTDPDLTRDDAKEQLLSKIEELDQLPDLTERLYQL